MILQTSTLRQRRLSLGITARELAKSAGVSSNLIERLEADGDCSTMRVETLESILSALSLELDEVVDTGPDHSPTAEDGSVEAIGCLLHDQRRAMPADEIASYLGLTLQRVHDGISELGRRLPHAGLTIVCRSTGFSITGTATAEARTPESSKHRRYLNNLNNGDLRNLHAFMTKTVEARTIANTNNGNVSLQRLIGAGIITIDDGIAALTPVAAEALTG